MDENLVSIEKLRKDINTAKHLFTFLNPQLKQQILDMEKQLHHVFEQIKLFNLRFSKLGWCAYDSLSSVLIEKANAAYDGDGLEAAERLLLKHFQKDIKAIYYVLKLKSEHLMIVMS